MTPMNAVQTKKFIKNTTDALKKSKGKTKRNLFFKIGNKNNEFIENVTNETKVLFSEIRSKLDEVKRNEGQLSKGEFVNLWGIVAHYWTNIINTTEVIQEVVGNSKLFTNTQKFVEDYNAFVTRSLKIPGKLVNLNSDAILNITKPLRLSRSRFVVARDLILKAFLKRQEAAWSPIVLNSQELARFTRKTSDEFHNFLGRIFLNTFSKHLYDFRMAIRDKDDERIRKKESAILCLLNQRCCGDPSPCLGLVSAQDTFSLT